MAFKQQIEVYTNEYCNFGVRDVSLDINEDLMNIALFWTPDNWTTVYGDFTNPTDHTWNITGINGVTYNFQAYYCNFWDPTGSSTCNADCIVWYNGYFWKNVSGMGQQEGVAPNPGADASVWVAMDATNMADFAAAAIIGCVLAAEEASGEILCPMFTVRPTTSCYIWQVCDISGVTGDKTVTVYEYGSTTVLTTYTLEEGQCVDVTLPEDGVYVIDILYQITVDLHEYHIAYEICQLKTCFTTLADEIICQTWDVCCEQGCTEAELKVLQQKRDTLNQMVALVGYIVPRIYVEYTRWGNILPEYYSTADETRDAYILKTQDAIERLKLIIDRCGLCDQMSNTTTTGCANCD